MTARTTLLTAALAVSVLSACADESPSSGAAGPLPRGHAAAPGAARPPAAAGQAARMYGPRQMHAVAEAMRARQPAVTPGRAASGGATRAQGGAAGP